MKPKGFQQWHLDLAVWVLTVAALVTCAVLEYLTEYKAGVMRHLYYRKMEHLWGIFSSEMLLYHISLAAALMLYALYKVGMKRQRTLNSFTLFIMPGLLLAAFYCPAVQDLYTYTYTLFSLETGVVALVVLSLLREMRRLKSFGTA